MATSRENSFIAPKDVSVTANWWCTTELKTNSISFLWTIKNFFYRPEDVGEFLTSSNFPVIENKGSNWVLNLFPNGISVDYKGYVSLYLKLIKGFEEKVRAEFKFSIVNGKGKKINTFSSKGTKIFHENTSLGSPQFIRKDNLFDQSSGLLCDGSLKLYCEISIIQDSVRSSDGTKSDLVESSIRTVSENFGDLFEDPLFSDIILNVNGKQICAHKAILSARSSVFSAMFKEEAKETTQSEIEIKDTSYETMKEILRFIYTGKSPNLDNMADILLSAADKYSLEQLKRLCEEVLESTITVENSGHLLLLADTHNANHLKSCAIAFINDHGSSVRNTDGWRNVVSRAPHLVVELYCTLFEQND